MTPLLAQAAPSSVNGAPLEQIAIVGVGTTVVTLLTLWLVVAYRAGRARPLRAVGGLAERVLGIPAWSAVPAIAGIAFIFLALFGVTWDVALHIDQGRDEGPLGTAAHYPILLGLLGLFQAALLAIGMAPAKKAHASRASLRIRGLWPVPISAALMLVAASLAFLGFPLDDVWHRIFGQDVTLWGPTHVQMIGCAILGVVAAVLLLVEGARAAGRDLRHPRGVTMRPIPVLLGAICLFGWAVLLGEFDWGVPQYRMVWHPLILAFAAAQGLVLARTWGGRGGALAAVAIYIPVMGALSLLVGGPLGQSLPSMPLFVVEALAIELLAARGDWRRPMRFGIVAGAVVGTVGFAAEYGWSQIAMPLPWTAQLLPEGLPTAIVAGIAGGVLSTVMVQALLGTSPAASPGAGLGAALRRPVVASSLAGIAVVVLAVNALTVSTPDDVRATITVSDVRTTEGPGYGGPQTTGNISVRFDPPSIAEDAHWVQAMGWQGKGSYVDRLTHQPDGSWTTSERAPLAGNWKTMIRVHKGRTMLAAPVYMPADPAVGFAGRPVEPTVTRPMIFDQEILQIERKDDVPGWIWTPAILLVLSIVALLVVATGVVAGRLGRVDRATAAAAGGVGLLAEVATSVLDRLRPHGPARGGHA
ncbi:hypothetical protein [Patulibacter defluvii]|uniref:hypothetical protein n=1 Tax=Patulibacter defluvii TaxID=3095358 RepID=UPI002A748103|nr:hypothetical protein [Patulibacter sp. DM4]